MARPKTAGAQFTIAAQATIAATQRLLVETAKREHARVMATDPRPGSFTRFVDGQRGAREEAVRADGVITYTYARLDVVVQFAMETLFDLSPVDSGRYRNSHVMFLNDVAVPNLEGWASGDVVGIVNYVPYARKIEHGKMTMRVPGSDRVYSQAERIVNRRFGNLATTRFTYRGIVDGVSGGDGNFNVSDIRYPALLISER